MFASEKKSPTALYFPFSPLLCIERLLKKLVDNVKSWIGLFRVLIMLLLLTLTVFQGSVFVNNFFIEQVESLILLVEGVSKFHFGTCPGQEQSFWWLWLLGSTSLLRKAYYNSLCWCGLHVYFSVLPFVSILKSLSRSSASVSPILLAVFFFVLLSIDFKDGFVLYICLSAVLLCSRLDL